MPILDTYRGWNWFKIKGENKFNGEFNDYSWEKWPHNLSAGFPGSRAAWWLKAWTLALYSWVWTLALPFMSCDFEPGTWPLWTPVPSVKWDNRGSRLTRVLWGVNESIRVKHPWQGLAHRKCIHEYKLLSNIRRRGGRPVLGFLWTMDACGLGSKVQWQCYT